MDKWPGLWQHLRNLELLSGGCNLVWQLGAYGYFPISVMAYYANAIEWFPSVVRAVFQRVEACTTNVILGRC